MKPFKEGESPPPSVYKKWKPKQEAKNGITHNNENVPASVNLVNERLEMAIKKGA